MDLDGTSVRSEEFWIWIIEKTTASMLDDESFKIEDSDIPFVSGHSVSEHLQYCIDKYCPGESLDKARNFYFEHVNHEMKEIMEGRGRKNSFVPQEGLKEFLLAIKAKGIKIGLVTSGLYEKAMPEILSAFRTLDMGEPTDFYDAIIQQDTRSAREVLERSVSCHRNLIRGFMLKPVQLDSESILMNVIA